MAQWIKALPELPAGSAHSKMPTNTDQTGRNIPFSAATALGRTFAAILGRPIVDEGVVETLHDVVTRTIRDLPRDGEHARLRQWMIQEIIRGGGGALPADYHAHLSVLFANIDHVVTSDIDDYEVALSGG